MLMEQNRPKKLRPSGVSKTQTQKNSDPRVSRKLRPKKTSRKTHQEKWMYPSPTDPKTKLPSAKFTTKYYCVKRDCILHRAFLISIQALLTFHPTFSAVCDSRISTCSKWSWTTKKFALQSKTSDALKRLYIQKCTTSATLFIIVLVKPVN